MFLKQPKKSPIFENEYKPSALPTEDEIRYIGRVHEECYYYQYGIDVCRKRIIDGYLKDPKSSDDEGFFRCKEVTDAFYNCATKDQFGKTIEDIDDDAKPFMKNYTTCLFKDQKPLGICRKYFDDILRFYVRHPDSKLKDVY